MTHEHRWEHKDTEASAPYNGTETWVHHAYCECGNGLHVVTRSSQPPDWDKYTEFDS